MAIAKQPRSGYNCALLVAGKDDGWLGVALGAFGGIVAWRGSFSSVYLSPSYLSPPYLLPSPSFLLVLHLFTTVISASSLHNHHLPSFHASPSFQFFTRTKRT
jgi:hypothetical protein